MDETGLRALTSPSAWWQWVKNHPVWSVVGALITIYALFGDAFSLLGDIVSNWSQIVHAPDHILYRWVFVLAGLGLIGFGAYRSASVESRLILRESAIRRDERNMISKDFKSVRDFQIILSSSLLKGKEIEELSNYMTNIDRDLNNYLAHRPAQEDTFDHSDQRRLIHAVRNAAKQAPSLAADLNRLILRIRLDERIDPDEIRHIVVPKFTDPIGIRIETVNGEIVRPQENSDLFRAHAGFSQQVRTARDQVAREIRRLKTERDAQFEKIRDWPQI